MRPPLWAAVLAAVLLAAQLVPLAPVRDAATGTALAGWTLRPSPAHLALTPLTASSDWVSCFGKRQIVSLLLWLLAAYWLARPFRRLSWRGASREAAGFGLHAAGVAAFVAWTAAVPRPIARLERPAGAGDVLVVDLHSHTSHSWDGRRRFTPERNLAWHADAGYDAAFVTDHNDVAGSRLAFEASALARSAATPGRPPALARALRGTELSLHGAHVVALGARERIDPARYEGLEGLKRFLGEAGPKHGALAVMSLPEYWKHHGHRLAELADWGAAGFELSNPAPKAADAPPSFLRDVVRLCEAKGLFLAGVSDNHGWSSSACSWTLLPLPGHEALHGEDLERKVLERLSSGFEAAAVAERPLRRPETSLGAVFDPFLNLFALLRALSRAQALVAFLYIGAAALFTARARRDA